MLHLLLHECGHVINGIATGGRYGRIEISVLGWSYAYLADYGEARAVAWGGFLWETVGSLVLFLSWWALRRPGAVWGLLFATYNFASGGVYMLTGLMSGRGDSANLARMSISEPALIGLAIALILIACLLSTLIAPLLRLGRRRTPYRQTLVALGTPVITLVAILAIHNVAVRPTQQLFWLVSCGGGAILALLCATWTHVAAPWVDGPELRVRSSHLTWTRSAVALGAGVVLAVGLPLCFPVTSHTRFSEAVSGNSADALKRLVSAHGHARNPLKPHETPLHMAAGYRKPDMVRLLLDLGAPVDSTNAFGRTALHMVAGGGTNAAEIATQLLDAGADPNANSRAGRPLHAAVWRRSPEMVSLLLSHGAVPTARDRRGRSPRDAAVIAGATNILSLLEAPSP